MGAFRLVAMTLLLGTVVAIRRGVRKLGRHNASKVKVFILMGQSNMLGFGRVGGDNEGTLEHAVEEEGLYPFLVDGDGQWTQRDDVRDVFVMGSGFRLRKNEWMGVRANSRSNIGPELGIGHHLGNYYQEPVLILKVCIGNRALGWDLLPPGSPSFEFTDRSDVTWVHPGYKGSPEKWKKGETPTPIGWYAGKQYDTDTGNAKTVLRDLGRYGLPGASYEVEGFFWWQGDRDSRSEALSSQYEKNLIQLVRTLRKDFDAPSAKFVSATLGQTKKGAQNGGGQILDAMFSITNATRYRDLGGAAATVYTHPLSMGGTSGGHYGGDARTYMNVGLAMGEAMVKLL